MNWHASDAGSPRKIRSLIPKGFTDIRMKRKKGCLYYYYFTEKKCRLTKIEPKGSLCSFNNYSEGSSNQN